MDEGGLMRVCGGYVTTASEIMGKSIVVGLLVMTREDPMQER